MRSAFDGLTDMPKRCNCESSQCGHAPGGCKKPAGTKKALYVGTICDDCASKTPTMYLLPPDGTARR